MRFYVKGAKDNKQIFQKFMLENPDLPFITTPCKIDLDIFVQTPKSFTKTQRLLAEMKILRPWNNNGDVDNFAKAVMDQMMPNEKRGHVGILRDDCLVIDLDAKKYYSVTPRYEVTITYMKEIPEPIASYLKFKDKI